IMAELRDQLSQYIGFEPSEICLPITEEDIQEFRKIIADQEKMTDIVMDEYRFLLCYGYNGKGDNRIHIGWLVACTVSQAEKVLINLPEDLSEKVLAHIEKRFEEVPLVPVLIRISDFFFWHDALQIP
ncbi:8714_t:CDS:2, partial [Gigaspora rosea]